MGKYFSFDNLITQSFVRVIYFLGFLLLTAVSIGIAIRAAVQLNQASIERSVGWQYLAAGIIALFVGNVLWRMTCELWIVLFNIHDRLKTNTPIVNTVVEDVPVREMRPGRSIVAAQPEYKNKPSRHSTASVLGLS